MQTQYDYQNYLNSMKNYEISRLYTDEEYKNLEEIEIDEY